MIRNVPGNAYHVMDEAVEGWVRKLSLVVYFESRGACDTVSSLFTIPKNESSIKLTFII